MLFLMENDIITSELPAKTPKAAKRKMSAAARKAVSDAAKARWEAKRAEAEAKAAIIAADPPIIVPAAPAPPSPAVLKLQEQVVELVSQRQQARAILNEAHNAYVAAQAKFQAAENELKGIEQEVNYRINLIAQLENRPQVTPVYTTSSAVIQMPGSFSSVTSEPAQPPQPVRRTQEAYAVGSADDLRRDIRNMM
jgi:hypothetical protein